MRLAKKELSPLVALRPPSRVMDVMMKKTNRIN